MSSVGSFKNIADSNNSNTYKSSSFSTKNGASYSQKPQINHSPDYLEKQLESEKRKRGLIEKAYDSFRNITRLGIGPKKVEQNIKAFKRGEITEKEAREKLSDYKISKESAAQNFGDLASGAITISTYFGVSKLIKMQRAKWELSDLNKIKEDMPKELSVIKKLLKSNVATKAIMLPALMFLGGMTKYWLLKFNRVGSKEFKVENREELDRKGLKKAKKNLKRQRHKQNFKNFYTGAFNGVLAPVVAVAGGIVGVPAYILATTGMRFITSKNDNKEKSLNNFGNNIKNSIGLTTLFTAALAIPALKKANFSRIFDKNLEKVVKELKGVELHAPDLPSTKAARQELTDILFRSPKIQAINLKSYSDINGSIHELIKENIFAAKLKQILNDGSPLSSALIENCPPTRTISEAQKEINKLLNSDKYQVSKLLGVGTIAESYLAKDKSGKEVCIKILKNGINAEKIQIDKQAFINMVTNGVTRDKLTKSQEYLVKNIENLAESVSKEIDFENEMKAAIKLSKSTKQAAVVVPIEAKPGVYVMEKAPGISLDTLVKYYQNEIVIDSINAKLQKGLIPSHEIKYAKQEIEICEKDIARLKAKSPAFNDFRLSNSEINSLLKNYIDVYVEQFIKVNKNGKTMHADIHPGNIFVNLEALKGKKAKLFTLIDTGNTIDLNKEQAMKAIKLTSFVKNGNVKDITSYVLNGAALPPNMTQEKAISLVEKDLNKIFFDKETKIKSMDSENLLSLTDNILRKHNIIPSDTQLTLNKAKTSASKSFEGLVESFFGKKYAKHGDFKDMDNKTKISAASDFGLLIEKMLRAKTLQESKNLFQMSFKEAMNTIKNPNMIKTNSEEHITYKLKQSMGSKLVPHNSVD